MERLTEITALGICGNNERVEHYPLYNIENDEHMAFGLINQCFEKLAEYEQAEEHGLLKRVAIGKWIFKNDGAYGKRRAYCSVCGKRSGIGGIESNQRKPYCPNCGANMKGE